jgi:threonine dehydratase
MITLDDVRLAAERLAPWIHRTPVLTCRALDERCGGSIFLKAENLQKIGAFKIRGAMNALLQLDDSARRAGVVTHSSGNHAQAVALAGRLLGIPAVVVMPHTAPAIKRAATEGYGACVVPCEPTLAARESTVESLIRQHGYTLVHPFDDWRVIAGQGTVAWELLEQVPDLGVVIAPVGGGGLLAGTALVVKERSPSTRVVGAEPERADDARRSLAADAIQPSPDPKTIADGLRTSLGERTFAVIRRNVDEIVTVKESEILEATRFVWERLKTVIEPSSAVAVSPAFHGKIDLVGRRVGIIISGGNVDLAPLFDAWAAKWL